MDRAQEEMQFLGLFGIYLESYKIIISFRKVFSKITLALILPLSFIFLAHIEVSQYLLRKIIHTERERDYFYQNTKQYEKLSDLISAKWATFFFFNFVYFTFLLIFSLLSTAAVVYTVASIYTGREVTFRKVMSVVPKVWKRLMVTFLCAFLAFLLYNVAAILTLTLWIVTMASIKPISVTVLIGILILYVVGFVYMTVVWQLASVISVLENLKGFKAMIKSNKLIKGKMWISILIFFKLILAMVGIQILFEAFVVQPGNSVGIAERVGLGLVCFLLLFKLFLFGLVIQTVIYFVCKSYHHENIDKSSLSDHLEVYLLGDYVRLNKDVQLKHFDV